MMKGSVAALLSVFALEACVHDKVLEPAADATLAPGRQNVAEASTAGVSLRVAGDAWKGDPRDLGTLFTPVRVTLENHSGKTVRVSYRDFTLAGGNGFHYAAIPPMKARGTLSSAAEAPAPKPAVERSSSSPPPSPLQGNVPVQTQGEARSQPADQDAPDASTVAAAPAARLQQSPAQAELENEQLGQVQDQLVQLRQQLADDESLRQDEKAEEAARHAATLESLDALRQAEASLATGDADGVDEQLAWAEGALSGRTRLDVEAAREALARSDLLPARQFLAAALAERRVRQ